MVPLLPLRDGVRALPISFFRQSMPSFYMNAPDCICSPGRLPLGAFCTGRDDQAVAFRLARSAISIHAPRVGRDAGWAIRCIHYSISIHAPRAGCDCDQTNFTLFTPISIHAPRAGCDGKFDGFTRPNLRKRYKKVSVQPKKRAKKKIKEMLCSHSQMLCSHSHIFGWISGAKVPEFPAR